MGKSSSAFSFRNLYKLLFSLIFMKRGVLVIPAVFFSAFIFSIGIVAAACINADDIILNLSHQTNAHGSVYNGAYNYPIGICYSDIFGSSYSYTGTGTVHDCTGTNLVLNLSAPTNAHAEAPIATTPGYSTGICYGNLNCVLESGSCADGRSPVVRLYNPKNSHLGNATSNYANIICCRSGGAGPPPGSCGDANVNPPTEQCDLGAENGVPGSGCTVDCQLEVPAAEAYWASTDGTQLESEAMIRVATDTVKLKATGVPPGATITFNISDEDCSESPPNPPCINDDYIKTATAVADAAGVAITGEIKFNVMEYEKGGTERNDMDFLILYFNATNTTASYSYSKQSTNLIKLNRTEGKIIVVDNKGCPQFTDQSICTEPTNPKLPGALAFEQEQYEKENYPNKVGGAYCGFISSTREVICKCLWNASAAKDNCYFHWKNISYGADQTEIDCTGGCNIQSSFGECMDDKMFLNYSASFGAESGCLPPSQIINIDEQTQCLNMNGQTDTLMCGLAPSLMLPFFSTTQFFITITAFIAIYTLIILKRRH